VCAVELGVEPECLLDSSFRVFVVAVEKVADGEVRLVISVEGAEFGGFFVGFQRFAGLAGCGVAATDGREGFPVIGVEAGGCFVFLDGFGDVALGGEGLGLVESFDGFLGHAELAQRDGVRGLGERWLLRGG